MDNAASLIGWMQKTHCSGLCSVCRTRRMGTMRLNVSGSGGIEMKHFGFRVCSISDKDLYLCLNQAYIPSKDKPHPWERIEWRIFRRTAFVARGGSLSPRRCVITMAATADRCRRCWSGPIRRRRITRSFKETTDPPRGRARVLSNGGIRPHRKATHP